MRLLVLYYSRTGNNRLLATALAARLGAEIEEVRPRGWRTIVSLLLDMARDRRPRVHPIVHQLCDFDHVLVLAPLWDMNVAHPMKTVLEHQRGEMPAYSFVTFCGYARDGQAAHVRDSLVAMTGRVPEHVAEVLVGELVSEGQRGNVTIVSRKRVTPAELAVFEPKIAAICAWFSD